MSNNENLKRFSNRVENYVRYRPGYPDGVVLQLQALGLLQPGNVIADIGSGTGLSARLFLDHGYTVYGVEPNKEMREAGDAQLAAYPAFKSVDGTAEHTTLPAASVELVLAGQAFHWFDVPAFRNECLRILKPGGTVALVWNDRRTDSTDFLKAYEDLLNMFGTDYKEVNHKNVSDEVMNNFFGNDRWRMYSVENHQDFTYEGLKGRLLSSSYVPTEDHPDFNFMLSVLKKIFLRYQENGTVRFEYDTKVYHGQF